MATQFTELRSGFDLLSVQSPIHGENSSNFRQAPEVEWRMVCKNKKSCTYIKAVKSGMVDETVDQKKNHQTFLTNENWCN